MFIELEDTKNLLNLIYVCDCTSEDNVVTYTMTNGSIIKEILSSAQAASDRVTDVKNAQIGGGGGSVNLQDKNETITENKTTTIQADTGYDGLGTVTVTTNVPAPTPNLQNKSIEITTNTTTNISADSGYDGLSQVSVTTNVPSVNISDYLVDTITENPLPGNNSGILQIIKTLPPDFNIDSGITDGTGLFRYLKNLVEIPNTLDTKNLNKINNMCLGCSSLVNVPILNFKGITGANATMTAFKSCVSLSDNSLNNIMQSLLSITEAYTGTRTLRYIGLTEEQATRCQSLPNYQALIDAGWTTGY